MPSEVRKRAGAKLSTSDQRRAGDDERHGSGDKPVYDVSPRLRERPATGMLAGMATAGPG